MSFWPTLPDARETLVAEVASVVREVCLGDKCRCRSVGYLRVDVGRSHDAVYVAHEDRFNLKRAKLAVTTSGLVIAAGFDGDKRG